MKAVMYLSGWADLTVGVLQRRRSAEDELAMRDYLQEGDLISVSSLGVRTVAYWWCLGRGMCVEGPMFSP